MNNNKFVKRGAANSTNSVNNSNENVRMNKHEVRVLRGMVKKTITAMTIIMMVISKNLPSVIRWVKQLNKCDNRQQLTLKALLATTIGEAAIYGMPTAVRNLLEGMDAPRPIIALTDNRKVIWLLNYIEDTYSSMNVKELVTLAGQAAAIGATIQEELDKKSYLPLHEPREMSDEEVRNL